MPTQEQQLLKMQQDIRDILFLIKGSGLSKEPGLVDRLIAIEEKQDAMEAKVKKLTNVLIGIGIGLVASGVIFGFVSWSDLAKIIKAIK